MDVHCDEQPTNLWSRLANYPLAVFEAAGGTMTNSAGETFLVVAGGYLAGKKLTAIRLVYGLNIDHKDSGWQELSTMPQALTHCAQAIEGDTLYTCGGFVGSAPGKSVADCYRYSVTTNEWQTLPSLPTHAGGGGLVYIAEMKTLMYASGMQRLKEVYGGVDIGNTYMLKLNDLAGGWERKSDMPNPRNHMAGVYASGRIMFIGGQHSSNEDSGNQDTVNEYLPWSNQWKTRASLPMKLSHISASTFRYWDGVVVVGGVTNGRRKVESLYHYDAIKDCWTWFANYPVVVQSSVCGTSLESVFCATGWVQPGYNVEAYSRTIGMPV